jgi:glycosyltransferase involved in cell wall biosynthesis
VIKIEPLVSILIPTRNRPHYFEQALKSALDQTYPNIEIIICDNSDDDQICKIVEKYKLLPRRTKIKYVRNENNIGPIANQHKCFDLSKGEYINYLMDDDLFHPAKINTMIKYFLNHNHITLVTSRKEYIDHDGSHKKKSYKLFSKNTTIDGIKLGNMLLINNENHIGEPTAVLFRKIDLEGPFGSFSGKQAENNVDVASWLALLIKGNAVYLTEPLCSIRKSSSQLSNRMGSKIRCLGDWIDHIMDSRNKNYLKNDADFIQAVKNLRKRMLNAPDWYKNNSDPYTNEFIKKIRILVRKCEKKKSLSPIAKEYKSLLDGLEKKKK